MLNNYQRYIQFLIPNAVDGIEEERVKVSKYTSNSVKSDTHCCIVPDALYGWIV